MLSTGFVLLLVLLLVLTYMVAGCRRGLAQAAGNVVLISVDAPGALLASTTFHPLSTNGPFLDLHFGPLDEQTPVGVTFYAHPLTTYTLPCRSRIPAGCGCGGKGEGTVTFSVSEAQRFVCFNDKTVSDAVAVEGVIRIAPFEWKGDGNAAPAADAQIVSASLTITNRTGLQLQGVHLHDGQRNAAGLTGFGKIVYFLFSSPEWNARYNTSTESVAWARAHCPLPSENVVPAHPDFLLQLGDGA